jgi:hypothetical protein
MQTPSAEFIEGLGLILAEHEAATAARLDDMSARVADTIQSRLDDINARVADTIQSRLDAIQPGAPGRDGQDKILLLPRHVGAGEPYAANDVAWHAGGIWQAVRNGCGPPDADPAGWRCLVPGIAAIETREDFATRELCFGFRLSDGTLHECRARMPAGALPADYQARGWGVIAGDTIRDGDFEREAIRDNPTGPADWAVREVRGRRGRDGKSVPGEPGRPGPGLVGLTLARNAQTGQLVIVPAFADPAVQAQPIAVDMLTEEPGPARHIIRTYAGKWRPGKPCGRGDVVTHAGGLWLSLRPDNDDAPADGPGWERML